MPHLKRKRRNVTGNGTIYLHKPRNAFIYFRLLLRYILRAIQRDSCIEGIKRKKSCMFNEKEIKFER